MNGCSLVLLAGVEVELRVGFGQAASAAGTLTVKAPWAAAEEYGGAVETLVSADKWNGVLRIPCCLPLCGRFLTLSINLSVNSTQHLSRTFLIPDCL